MFCPWDLSVRKSDCKYLVVFISAKRFNHAQTSIADLHKMLPNLCVFLCITHTKSLHASELFGVIKDTGVGGDANTHKTFNHSHTVF